MQLGGTACRANQGAAVWLGRSHLAVQALQESLCSLLCCHKVNRQSTARGGARQLLRVPELLVQGGEGWPGERRAGSSVVVTPGPQGRSFCLHGHSRQP